jgi:hypothetical protein
MFEFAAVDSPHKPGDLNRWPTDIHAGDYAHNPDWFFRFSAHLPIFPYATLIM